MANVALVPARAGSMRVPGKNTKPLGGEPLIAWTVRAAVESGCYDLIVVASDDPAVLAIARSMKVVAYERDPVPDDQPDIAWVVPLVEGEQFDTFSILRPTSPFRGPETIRRAFAQWDRARDDAYGFTSLRAVRTITEHPHKMWWMGYSLEPLSREFGGYSGYALAKHTEPWSQPTQVLPKFYVQTAGLEIAHSRVLEQGSISGDCIAPFIVDGPEALDCNTLQDWWVAERYVQERMAWWQA